MTAWQVAGTKILTPDAKIGHNHLTDATFGRAGTAGRPHREPRRSQRAGVPALHHRGDSGRVHLRPGRDRAWSSPTRPRGSSTSATGRWPPPRRTSSTPARTPTTSTGWYPSSSAVVIAGPLMGLGMERIAAACSQQSVAWKIVGDDRADPDRAGPRRRSSTAATRSASRSSCPGRRLVPRSAASTSPTPS